MFEKVLVANRGEIAVRIIRACKELNIRTVAVYSEIDANSMHVQMADEAICIGKAASSESYLRIDRIISAAEIADVDAIHPGYGFLSENAHFAEVCESCNIRFIGPSSRAMQALEDKAISRALAKKAGVAIPPGSEGPLFATHNHDAALTVFPSGDVFILDYTCDTEFGHELAVAATRLPSGASSFTPPVLFWQ